MAGKGYPCHFLFILKITNPKEFGSVSKYLVIQVK